MADKQYIERDTCRDVLMRFLNSPCIQCGDYPSIMSVETCIKLFDSVPAADVVEVVRCENCQHCKMVVDIIGDPHLFCGLSPIKVKKQFGDFCSDGERKEATP